jgi:hypothetical protein
MKKLKKMPKLAREIIITVISFVVLCLLWAFFIEKYIVIPDQGLSTIGIALSTSMGVLTAIVVSFVIIIWQTSRRDRSESFLRWKNTSQQLIQFYDANLEKFKEVQNEVMALTLEASAVAFRTPISFERFIELTSPLMDKIGKAAKLLGGIKNPSAEQVEKAKLYTYMSDYIVTLTHVNFEHNVAHNLYKGLLDLRGLLYRLLSLLILCVIVVAIAATTTTTEISDTFNAPLALILVGWAIYLLVRLGMEIKILTRLEDVFRRQESEIKDKPQVQEKK